MRGTERGLAVKGPQVAPNEHSFSRNASMMAGWARAEPWFFGEDWGGVDLS